MQHAVITPRTQRLLLVFLLIATVYFAFASILEHRFINYNDDIYITKNPHVQRGFTLDGIRWALTDTHVGHWHPLTYLSHMLDCQIFGLNAGGHHLTSLLLHIGNTLLLMVIFFRMTGGLWSSFLVAALFGLHPLHVESVAWAAERKDVLSTFLMMLTVLAYIRYSEKPCAKRYAPVFIGFLLGLLAKPMLLTLPFVLLLLDYWPLRRLGFPEKAPTNEPHGTASIDRFKKTGFTGLLAEKIPLFFFSALSSIMTYVAAQSAAAVGSSDMYPINERLANASVSYLDYLFKMIWPADLAVFYPYTVDHALWKVTAAVLVLVGITALAITTAKKRPYLVVGWFWYLGVLAPVIGLVQAGGQSMADQYTYVSFIGLFIMLAWGIPDLLNSWRHRALALSAIAVVIIPVLTMATSLQVRHWENSVTLYEHALSVTKGNYLAHNNLGAAFTKAGKVDEAMVHFRATLRIAPEHADAHYNLGLILANKGDPIQAVHHLRQAIRSHPDHYKAHHSLASVLYDRGNAKEAIDHYREALRIMPSYVNSHFNLAFVLESIGREDEALRHYRLALENDPGHVMSRLNIGAILAGRGMVEEAADHFMEVLRTRPDYVEAYVNLGAMFARRGKMEEAIGLYQNALQIKPRFHQARFFLGRAYMRMGDHFAAFHEYQILQNADPALARRLYDEIERRTVGGTVSSH